MAKINTTTNPTFKGFITHPSNGVTTAIAGNMEWEVRGQLKAKAKNFGYDLQSAVMHVYDMDAGDYVLSQAHTDRIFETKKKGEKVATERLLPVEAHFDATTAGNNAWSASMRNAKSKPVGFEEALNLAQVSIEQLIKLGITPKQIATIARQLEHDLKAEAPLAE